MRAAWPKLEYVFSVRRSNEEGKSEASPEPAHVIREPHRLSNGLLNQHPVYLLTIEQGISSKFAFEFRAIRLGKLVGRMKPENRPRVVIESWPPNTQLWTKGPACKSTTSRWYDLNYVFKIQESGRNRCGRSYQSISASGRSSKIRVEPLVDVGSRGNQS